VGIGVFLCVFLDVCACALWRAYVFFDAY